MIVRIGSNKKILHDLALEIYSLCRKSCIDLTITWVSRKFNQVSDAISENIDYDDWTTKSEFFLFFQSIWGEFTIDLFADNENRKCNRFCSRYWCPGTFKVDAFSFDWTGENSWIVPPTYLVTRCIKHFFASRGNGSAALLVPF